MFLQRTIKNRAEVKGVGLHTGKPVRIVFRPAPVNTGVCFLRSDLKNQPTFKAWAENIHGTKLATTLGSNEVSISTIEHCMSVITAYRIDNLIIEIDGPEVPVGDGSALIFKEALLKAGLVSQKASRKYAYIKDRIHYGTEDKYTYIEPYNGLRISCTIDFPHPLIGRQFIDLDINEESFSREICEARTFGFLEDFKKLKSQGLALGSGIHNTIGLTKEGLMEGVNLRYKDEFVRHKVLDALGDLATLGKPLLGHVVLYKAGHDLLNQLVQKILSQPDSYKEVDLADVASV